MLSENFVTSIRAQHKSNNTAIAKDNGIYVHTLYPTHKVQSSFKKSSTPPNCTAVSSTHIFAAQAEKAVVHVYSNERGNQESLVSFPERIHSITLVHDGLLALGTAEGRVILWELCTGRQIFTPASHLQAVSCLASTYQHLISGSEDSNLHVWSVPSLISVTPPDLHEPVRSLSNHRDAITSIVMGHSATDINICVSASKDQTCIIWNYHTGEFLRTFLLPSTPLCLALDPCDRAVYVGFEDGSIRSIELFKPTSTVNSLHDKNLQSTPVQVLTECFRGTPPDVGSVHCLGLSYDGTVLLSGHASGKLIRWDAGPQKFSVGLTDLNAPITNLIMLSPFPKEFSLKAVTVIKPRMGQGDHVLTGQFVGSFADESDFERALYGFGIPSEMLEAGILELSRPIATTNMADEQLRKENEELWAVINEQRALQKVTYEKYLEAKNRR